MDLPDSAQKISRGVALGVYLDFLPIPIISIPISFLLAKILRVNAAASVFTVILFKWAVPFFFTLNYFVGKSILGNTAPEVGIDLVITSFADWLVFIKHLGYPFLAGAFINGALASTAAYFLIKWLLERRKRRKKKSKE